MGIGKALKKWGDRVNERYYNTMEKAWLKESRNPVIVKKVNLIDVPFLEARGWVVENYFSPGATTVTRAIMKIDRAALEARF